MANAARCTIPDDHSERPPKHAVLMPLKATPTHIPIDWVIALGASGFTGEQFTLFVGVDADDLLWRDVHRSQAEALLKAASITMVEVTSPAEQPRGAVCTVWDRLARVAVLEHECDGLLILSGDDVRYAPKDKAWIDDVWTSLSAMPGGLGLAQPCDATDLSCCTFPILTAAHVHLFERMLPSAFETHAANQDGDPFLKELYRRAGAVLLLDNTGVHNAVGGPRKSVVRGPSATADAPRYSKRQVPRTVLDAVLNDWASTLRVAISAAGGTPPPPTVDIVVPTYRCDVRNLLAVQKAVREVPDAFLIVQVDNPASDSLNEVLRLEDTDTRVRVNERNSGASATRNHGLAECWGHLVVFLDDDVLPEPGAVGALRDAIAYGSVCGAVGRVVFPPSNDVWHEATRLSMITVAFDWPRCFPPGIVPWGVTASLGCWRKLAVEAGGFDLAYAKAGGGEDVAFCIDVQRKSGGQPWTQATKSVVVHPFWPRKPGLVGVARYLKHFWMWTTGDGQLLDSYKDHVYLCFPNFIEWALLTPFCFAYWDRALLMLWLVEMACEAVDAFRGPYSRHLPTGRRVVACLLSSIVKNVVDAGHAAYFLRRGRPGMLCSRFDWFLGVTNGVVQGERWKFAVRTLLWMAAIAIPSIEREATLSAPWSSGLSTRS